MPGATHLIDSPANFGLEAFLDADSLDANLWPVVQPRPGTDQRRPLVLFEAVLRPLMFARDSREVTDLTPMGLQMGLHLIGRLEAAIPPAPPGWLLRVRGGEASLTGPGGDSVYEGVFEPPDEWLTLVRSLGEVGLFVGGLGYSFATDPTAAIAKALRRGSGCAGVIPVRFDG